MDFKKKYADKIRICFGFEQDYYSDQPPVPVDYLIGSVHYIKCGDDVVCYFTCDNDVLNALKKLYRKLYKHANGK